MKELEEVNPNRPVKKTTWKGPSLMKKTVEDTIEKFCAEFVTHPYICYTEHGQHARFYSHLYGALPEKRRYVDWKQKKVCSLQKEYPTAGALGKTRRQHWDIALIKSPAVNGG